MAPALNDLIGGHIQLLSADLPVLEPLVKSGKVRALALFATERSPLLPDVPTSAELGYPGMLMSNWYGMLAPAGTPAAVIASLEQTMKETMKSPQIAARLAAGGLQDQSGAARSSTTGWCAKPPIGDRSSRHSASARNSWPRVQLTNRSRSCGAVKSSAGPSGTMPVGFTFRWLL